MNAPRPPAHIQPYIDALGVEQTVAFLLHFGGAELYIPRDPKGASAVVQVLGLDAARALAALAERSALPRRVPTAKPWLANHLKHTDRLSHAEIARRLHVSDVSVRRWLATAGAEPHPSSDQLSLF